MPTETNKLKIKLIQPTDMFADDAFNKVIKDLDNKVVEFFLNGKSLGIAYKDVLIGKNIAYFPGVSLRKKEQ